MRAPRWMRRASGAVRRLGGVVRRWWALTALGCTVLAIVLAPFAAWAWPLPL